MEHVDYDSTIVIGSIVLAVIICFVAISLQQLIFKKRYLPYEKIIMLG